MTTYVCGSFKREGITFLWSVKVRNWWGRFNLSYLHCLENFPISSIKTFSTSFSQLTVMTLVLLSFLLFGLKPLSHFKLDRNPLMMFSLLFPLFLSCSVRKNVWFEWDIGFILSASSEWIKIKLDIRSQKHSSLNAESPTSDDIIR